MNSLVGIRIVVTRAGHQASALSAKLSELGATVIELPTIEIAPPENWNSVDEAITRIDQYDWILLASQNAVQHFMSRWKQNTSSQNYRGNFATIGPSTTAALKQWGIEPAFQPGDSYVSESFIEEFPDYPNLIGHKILWPRTNIGRDVILEKFVMAGAEIDVVEAYRTVIPTDLDSTVASLTELLMKRSIDIITVASSQSVRNLAKILRSAFSLPDREEAADVRKVLRQTAIISIGPQTTATAVECLGKCEGQAEQFTVDGLVEAVLNYVKTNAGT
ncbi:MAG TPA: uroporphyrinogen-III synthase [Drouetiella sp.]